VILVIEVGTGVVLMVEVDQTEEDLEVEAVEGGIKVVVGTTEMTLVRIGPPTGTKVQGRDGKIVTMQELGTMEVVIRTSGRVGMQEVVELAIKLVVGIASCQVGTSQQRLKMLPVAGTKELAQLMKQVEVRKLAVNLVVGIARGQVGTSQKRLKMLLVAGTKELAQQMKQVEVRELAVNLVAGIARGQVGSSHQRLKMLLVAGTKEPAQLMKQVEVRETIGDQQMLLVGAGQIAGANRPQPRKLKNLMIKGVAGMEDPSQVLNLGAGTDDKFR
jgi:dihydroxyacetone kinase DhaKLM complex PTS-EIIA-like component DhaM